jgi:membrane protease YdiL (CAAX protease family)
MNPLIKIFVSLVLSVFIGALLAPLFYQIVLLLPADRLGAIGQLLVTVQQMPFHRYLSRAIQIVAFVLLWPTILSLKIKRLSDLSLYRNEYASRDFLGGLVAALLPLWVLELLLVCWGWYLFDGFSSWGIGLKVVAAALAVALFEEFLFRGVLLGLSRRFFRDKAAVVFVALLFAGVHFFNLPRCDEPVISWWSGVALLFQADGHAAPWPLALGAFMTLFLLGLILGWATVITRSLWLAIGLHAGSIAAQQLFHAATHENFAPLSLLPWWGPFQIHGMVPVGLLVVLPLGITLLWVRSMVASRVAFRVNS